MLKMHLIVEVLRMICAVYGIADVVQTIDKLSYIWTFTTY